MNYIISIDGSSGTGKSTQAKLLAKYLCNLGHNTVHLNSGSIYRTISCYFYLNSIDITDENVISNLDNINITCKKSFENSHELIYLLNNEDVSHLIRTQDINELVPTIAKIPEVREKCLLIQKEIAESYNIIVDGRDTGDVVFPDAQIKFYFKSDFNKVAKIRYDELRDAGNNDITLEAVYNSLVERDKEDRARSHSPLRDPRIGIDIVIDTTYQTEEETLQELIEHIQKVIN